MSREPIKVELGSIPGRTRIEVSAFVTPGQTELKDSQMSKHYSCMDCKFSTKLVEEMFEHQKNANLWHRLKKRFNMRLFRPPKPVEGDGMAQIGANLEQMRKIIRRTNIYGVANLLFIGFALSLILYVITYVPPIRPIKLLEGLGIGMQCLALTLQGFTLGRNSYAKRDYLRLKADYEKVQIMEADEKGRRA